MHVPDACPCLGGDARDVTRGRVGEERTQALEVPALVLVAFAPNKIAMRIDAERPAAVFLGAHIVRVHNVRAMVDVVRVADRIRGGAGL